MRRSRAGHAPVAPVTRQEDTLHVFITRHPYEWAESMRRNAFYASLHKGREMGVYLTLEWLSMNIQTNAQKRCGEAHSVPQHRYNDGHNAVDVMFVYNVI